MTTAAPATATATISPGAAFAAAFAEHGEHTEVTYDYTVTGAHKPDRPKPRLTVPRVLKRQLVTADVTSYWYESVSTAEQAATVTESGLRREAAFRPGMASARLYPIQAWVQIPEGLADYPAGLAAYIDVRLLVRLATAENQALTIGPHGLLNHPGIARLPYRGDFATGLLAACDAVEQVGSTAHAAIVNPTDFYLNLAGRGSLLADLDANGTLISRTRMIPVGQALAGDFAEAVRLLDAGRSVIRVAEPPEGTFAQPGLAVCAEVYEGLAVHLPTNIFLAVPADGPAA